MDAIRRLRDLGSTILLVEEKAHEVLEVADTVAFMELGRLVWMGPCDQLDEERLAGHLPGDGDVSLRVVHWGTGNTGRLALRGVLQHPDLELVGLYVHNPDKVGRDAGELIGLDAAGVVATSDVDELLAIDADCLCYLGDGIGPRAAGAVEEMSRFLRAGRNVVSTSLNQLVNPKTAAGGAAGTVRGRRAEPGARRSSTTAPIPGSGATSSRSRCCR